MANDGNVSESSDPKKEGNRDRLDMMWNLSKAARDRFNARSQIEWKVSFGLWTAFGATAGFVVSSTTWKPGWVEFTGIAIVVLMINGVFFWWTKKRHEFDQLDSQTSYFWESAIEREIDRELNRELRPGRGTWLRYGDDSRRRPKYDWRHPGLITQVSITVLFGILVILSALSRAPGQSSQEKTSETIETK